MSLAIVGVGAKLQVDISSVYTDVVEIVSIDGPQIQVGDVDVTHLQSPNQFREFLPGLGDGGVLNMEANYTKAQMNTLYGFLRVTKPWRILFSDGSKWDLNGYINAISTTAPLEDESAMPFSIKVTGKPVFTQ